MSTEKIIHLTESELRKLAMFVMESGRLIKQATELGKNLFEDNEKLAEEIEHMREEKHAAERAEKINKIAEVLNTQGLISKASIPQKINELNKMADETLDQLSCTMDGLVGTQTEKKAAEGTLSSFEFLDAALYNEVFNDGKPRPLSLK